MNILFNEGGNKNIKNQKKIKAARRHYELGRRVRLIFLWNRGCMSLSESRPPPLIAFPVSDCTVSPDIDVLYRTRSLSSAVDCFNDKIYVIHVSPKFQLVPVFFLLFSVSLSWNLHIHLKPTSIESQDVTQVTLSSCLSLIRSAYQRGSKPSSTSSR
jgi:hypothetical protein